LVELTVSVIHVPPTESRSVSTSPTAVPTGDQSRPLASVWWTHTVTGSPIAAATSEVRSSPLSGGALRAAL
jgi:hypothetical protein